MPCLEVTYPAGAIDEGTRKGLAESLLVAALCELELFAEVDNLGVVSRLLSSQVVEPPHRFVERLPELAGACGWLAQGLVDQPLNVGGKRVRLVH